MCSKKIVQELIQPETLMQDASLVHARVIGPAECKNVIKSNLVIGIGGYIFCMTLYTMQGQKQARAQY